MKATVYFEWKDGTSASYDVNYDNGGIDRAEEIAEEVFFKDTYPWASDMRRMYMVFEDGTQEPVYFDDMVGIIYIMR